MDHTYIEENQVAERYVAGTLPDADRERFEDHYLSCQECLDRLEVTEALQRGFKRMAGQDVAALTAARQLAIVAWLSRLSRSHQLGSLVAILLVLVVLPGGFAWRGVTVRRELAQVRSELERERQRLAASAGSTEEVQKLRAELEASRRERAGEHEQLVQALKPQANVPMVSLDVERGAGAEPANRFPQPAAGRIDFELPVNRPFQTSYCAILRDSQGHEIARVEDLHPSKRDSLTLSLPAGLTPPGDYTFAIEGLTSGGKSVAGGRFPFRITPHRG